MTDPVTRSVVIHHYVSTACLHGLHDRCRRTCKFCDTPCRCVDCDHDDVVDATIVCGAQHPTHGWDCGLPEGHDGRHLADTTWWTWGDPAT